MLKNFLEEINKSKTLVIFMYWSLLSFAISFSTWIGNGYTGPMASFPCWPHFTECKNIFPLIPMPYGYSETIWYAFLFGLITLGLYKTYKKDYTDAFFIILFLWLWKLFVINVTYGIGNFDYYDIVLIGIFLFFRDRLHFLRLGFVLLYFLASTIKIHDGWILGTYFTSLYTGTPIFGNYLAPVFSNIVIFMQLIGAWWLLGKNNTLRYTAITYFVFFHLFSIIFVNYRYPLTALFVLVILFISEHKTETTYLSDLSIKSKNIFNWLALSLLIILQFIAIIIPGDQKLTLEGNQYSLYMFEANHQCISRYKISYNNNKSLAKVKTNADSRNRCDPYIYYDSLKKICDRKDVKSISWTFEHSINGEPFKKIVDTENVCALEYRPFVHNQWINIDNPKVTALANQNIYDLTGRSYKNNNDVFVRGDYTGNAFIENTPPVTRTGLQDRLAKYTYQIKIIYWVLWTYMMLYFLYNIIKGINNSL